MADAPTPRWVWSMGRSLHRHQGASAHRAPAYARVHLLPTGAEGDDAPSAPSAPLGQLTLTVAPKKAETVVVKRTDPTTNSVSSGEVAVEEVAEVSPLTALVAVLAHTRDASLLILGGSMLHIASNTLAVEDGSKLKDCIFFATVPLIVLALLWITTLVCAIARIFGFADGLVLNTALDFCLVFLGSALQMSTKPAAWAQSAQDELFCTIAPTQGSAVGPVPLLVWLLGESLSFLSFGRSLADWGARPPWGTSPWPWVIGLFLLGLASFPIVDLALAPALRDLASSLHAAMTADP